MSETMIATAGNANSGSAETALKKLEPGAISFHLARLLRGIYPRKTWRYLGMLIGTTQRVSKHRLAGTRSYSVEEVALLLRTEHGRGVLAVLMGQARPKWYAQFIQQHSIAETKRKLAAASAELDAINADIERAETAGRIGGENFLRPDVDGLRQTFGAENRAVDQTKRK